jgi:hypothetical protein
VNNNNNNDDDGPLRERVAAAMAKNMPVQMKIRERASGKFNEALWCK